MTTQHYTQLDVELASEHTRPDWIAKLLYRDRPHFHSVKQFGWFVALVIDRWGDGGPGLRSSWGLMSAFEKYGTVIDTSPHPVIYDGPNDVYHVDWIQRVLEVVAVELTTYTKTGEVKRDGVLWVQTWALSDVFDYTNAETADAAGLSSRSSAQGRVSAVRDALRVELRRLGYLDGSRPSGKGRRRDVRYWGKHRRPGAEVSHVPEIAP